jgi:spore coat protein U-like protein
MSFRTKSLLAAAIVAAGLSTAAQAATDSKNFNVTITITESCDISTGAATDVDFGTQARSTGPYTATGNLIVNCSSGTPYDITLGQGANYSSGRRMANGTNYVPYELYSDSGMSTSWVSVHGTGTAANQNIPVYGKVLAASTNVPAGAYTDTVTATITY